MLTNKQKLYPVKNYNQEYAVYNYIYIQKNC